MQNKINYELEKLRREYDLKIQKLHEKYTVLELKWQARFDMLQNDTQRVRSWTERQDNQLSQLVAISQKVESETKKAITPVTLRNWIIGLSGFLGAIMTILTFMNLYNNAQIVRHEEKMRIEEPRKENSFG